MDLLFINRSYWPDVEATGQLLTELCTDLARSHRVTVIAGRPNFVEGTGTSGWMQREEHDGVEILRVGNHTFSKQSFLGRVIGLSSYLLLAAWAALSHRRPDVIVTETDPPVLGALGALLRVWHHCHLVVYLQDMFPEVGLILGKLKPGPLTFILHLATQLGLRRADRVVVLGEDMKRRVRARGIRARKIEVVPNWVDTRQILPGFGRELRREWDVDNRFVVMYSGNIGLSQGLDGVLEAARDLRGDPVEFIFVGEGAAKASLTEQARTWGLENVRFLPYQRKERLCESLGAADAHLVPLQRGLAGYIVPSKLYGILAVGRPYIAAVDADSEVAAVTQEGQCGLRIEPDAPRQLVDAIRWCVGHPEELRSMGQRGRDLAEARFDRAICVHAFTRALESL